MSTTFDVAAVRKHFPALDQKQVYFDNAGGSQVLKEVIDSISNYLMSNNVQLGASYPVAQSSTMLVDKGCKSVADYINASPEEVVLGPSTTQLFRNLSVSLYDYITPDSEIIVSKLDHEANVASWLQLAKDRQCTLKWYEPVDKKNPQIDCDVLQKLMTPKTKLFACTHTSNILGTINDVKAIAKTVHETPGALLCVDAVAYSPHRAIDVRDWGVDFYSFSWYKVYGPHIATLYASKNAQKHMRSLGHFFKSRDTLENLLGLAAGNYELTSAIPEVCKYLQDVPWDEIAKFEEKLQAILIDYLNSKPDLIQIWGEPVADLNKRVCVIAVIYLNLEAANRAQNIRPVISFTIKRRSSREIVETVEAKSNFGFRWGSFYSNRLIEEVLGLDAEDGVIRVSLLHYNTEEEVREFVKVLDEVISS